MGKFEPTLQARLSRASFFSILLTGLLFTLIFWSPSALSDDCKLRRDRQYSSFSNIYDGDTQMYHRQDSYGAMDQLETMMDYGVCTRPINPPECQLKTASHNSAEVQIVVSGTRDQLYQSYDPEEALLFWVHLVRLGQCDGELPENIPPLIKPEPEVVRPREEKSTTTVLEENGKYYRFGSYWGQSLEYSTSRNPPCTQARRRAEALSLTACLRDQFQSRDCRITDRITTDQGPVFLNGSRHLKSFCEVRVFREAKVETEKPAHLAGESTGGAEE